MYKRIRFQN